MKRLRVNLVCNLYLLWACVWTPVTIAVCETERLPPSLSIEFSKFDTFNTISSEIYGIDSTIYNLSFRGKHWRAGHEYRAFNYPGDIPFTPLTNGHLHNLHIGYAGTQRFGESNQLLWEALPTLAISSNQLKNRDKIQPSSTRLDGHFAWRHKLQRPISTIVGICATALSGEYGFVPIAGFSYSAPSWQVLAAYPHSRIHYPITASLTVYASWGIAGNQWEILDKNLENRTKFHYASKKVNLGIQYSHPAFGDYSLYWLHRYDQRLTYFARSHSWVSVDTHDTQGWMIQYSLRLHSN